jgi:SHC-transforming protein 1
MPSISFATGGDQNEYDMIGYVAKDMRNVREVHVFDCGHMAHDIIATVGQAFELRFKAFLAKQARGAPGLPGAANQLYLQQQGYPQQDLYADTPGTSESSFIVRIVLLSRHIFI